MALISPACSAERDAKKASNASSTPTASGSRGLFENTHPFIAVRELANGVELAPYLTFKAVPQPRVQPLYGGPALLPLAVGVELAFDAFFASLSALHAGEIKAIHI